MPALLFHRVPAYDPAVNRQDMSQDKQFVMVEHLGDRYVITPMAIASGSPFWESFGWARVVAEAELAAALDAARGLSGTFDTGRPPGPLPPGDTSSEGVADTRWRVFWRDGRATLHRETRDGQDEPVEVPAPATGEMVARLLRPAGGGSPTGHPAQDFGYKTGWLAVRGARPEDVLAALSLADVQQASWDAGLTAAHGRERDPDLVFVTRPVDGWVFAVGLAVLFTDFGSLAAQVSARLGVEAQGFATHRVSETHGWARAIDGRTVREYEAGDGSIHIHSSGEPTEVERSLGLPQRDADVGWDSDNPRLVGEEDVMAVAGAWSLDPTRLSWHLDPVGHGWLGRLPR
jgi:hypothetical protein